MRPTWKTIRNEIKRGDSVELSHFFVFGDSQEMSEKIRKVFFSFMTFGLVVLMFGSASGQQARNIIKLKKTGNCKKCFLLKADLKKAKLQGAKLQGSNLEDVKLDGAILCHTTMSDGKKVYSNCKKSF